MAIVTKIEFDNTINSSLQMGDVIYVSDILTGERISDPPALAGNVLDISSHYIVIDKNPVTPPIISNGQFIFFAKNIQANESSLKGYYADVTFENSSNTKTELFAISSEVAPSSK